MRLTEQGYLNLFDDSKPTQLVATVAPGHWKVAEYVEAQALCRCSGFSLTPLHNMVSVQQ
jgi:hypothetical protein